MARPAVVYLILFGSIGSFFPYIAVYYRSIGLSVEAIGLLTALQAAVALAAAPVWGALVDQLGSVRGAIALAGLATAASAALLGVVRDPVLIALAVIGTAAWGSGIIPMVDSRTVDLLGPDRDRFGRARAWGSVGFIVVSLAVGGIIDRLGPASLFLVEVPGFALVGLAGWALLGGATRGGRRLIRVTSGEILGLLRQGRMALFLAGSILLWTAVAAVTTFFSIHLVSLGAPAEVVGFAWALGAFVEVPLMFSFDRIVRRVRPEWLLVVGVVAFAVRAAGFALSPSVPLVLLMMPLGGVGFAFFYVGTVTYVARSAPPRLQATAQGIYSGTAFSVGTILGSTIGGQVGAALGLRALFGLGAVGAALAAVVIGAAVMRPPARETQGSWVGG